MQCEPHKRRYVMRVQHFSKFLHGVCAPRLLAPQTFLDLLNYVLTRAVRSRPNIPSRPASRPLALGFGARVSGLGFSALVVRWWCRLSYRAMYTCGLRCRRLAHARPSGSHVQAAQPRRAVSCVGAARVPSAHSPNYRVHWFVCLPLLSFVGNEGTAKLHSDRTLKQPYWFNKQVGAGALGCRPQRAGRCARASGWVAAACSSYRAFPLI